MSATTKAGPPARTLRGITDEFRALADLLSEGAPELEAEAAAAMDAWYCEIVGQESAKLDGYVDLIRHFESREAVAKAEADQFRAEAERYAAIAQVQANAARRLKTRLMEHLIATGQPKVTTATGRTVRVQKNGTAPFHVAPDLNLDAVPAECVKVVKSLDSDAVKARIKAGETFPFAWFGEAGSHLRIH